MTKFIIISLFSYVFLTVICYQYTIAQLDKLFRSKSSHINIVKMFHSLKIVSFIPILNFFYFVFILESTLKNK